MKAGPEIGRTTTEMGRGSDPSRSNHLGGQVAYLAYSHSDPKYLTEKRSRLISQVRGSESGGFSTTDWIADCNHSQPVRVFTRTGTLVTDGEREAVVPPEGERREEFDAAVHLDVDERRSVPQVRRGRLDDREVGR